MLRVSSCVCCARLPAAVEVAAESEAPSADEVDKDAEVEASAVEAFAVEAAAVDAVDAVAPPCDCELEELCASADPPEREALPLPV